jgi:hypothetical protein
MFEIFCSWILRQLRNINFEILSVWSFYSSLTESCGTVTSIAVLDWTISWIGFPALSVSLCLSLFLLASRWGIWTDRHVKTRPVKITRCQHFHRIGTFQNVYYGNNYSNYEIVIKILHISASELSGFTRKVWNDQQWKAEKRMSCLRWYFLKTEVKYRE